jgi:FkbM family methyltransferase
MSSYHTPISLPVLLRWVQTIEFRRKLGVCERLFGVALARHGPCWVRTAVGLTWRLDLRNPTHRWIVYGYYEGAGFLRWAKANLSADSVVVDSGANIGQMALYFGHWVRHGRVFAFEPGGEAATWLAECLSCQSNLPIALQRMGLSDREGTASLANSLTDKTHGSQAAITTGAGEAIRLTRLDRFLAEQGVDEVALWKLDVEGHEIPALLGAGTMLSEHRIKALYVELAGDNGLRICEFLARFGYRPHDLDLAGRVTAGRRATIHGNALFLAP